ncbi:hypothetical protein AB0V79_12910 [Mesorhizobium ciceri]|nr:MULTISPECIES: hypothetical protein [Mesorhizobium]MDF3206844.1 hypothetical protein [Mesorhizobium sp. LMG15046]MDF3213703.1 hypothetical protein [Mesorhizobium ciceri]MDF3230410.1 hypothetical protein [Mesorhizobium sp. DSM 30133]
MIKVSQGPLAEVKWGPAEARHWQPAIPSEMPANLGKTAFCAYI